MEFKLDNGEVVELTKDQILMASIFSPKHISSTTLLEIRDGIAYQRLENILTKARESNV